MKINVRERNPFVVGGIAIIVIALFVLGAFAAGFLHLLNRTYGISAVVSDAAGIRTGDDVRVAGVKVGRVTGIRAEPGRNDVIVTLAVDTGVKLGPDTHAAIALMGLLGERFVRLTGDVTPPYLAAGAVIPLDRTTTPFDPFEIAGETTRSFQKLDAKTLNRLIGQLAAVTGGKQADIKRLVEGLDQVSQAVASRDTELRDLLDHAKTLSATLADKDVVIQQLIDQSSSLLAVLADKRDDLASLLQGTDATTGALAQLVHTNKAAIDSILAELHPILGVLDKRQQDLDQALSWLGPGVLALSLPGIHGPWVDLYVRAIGPDVIQGIEDLAKAAHK